MLPRLLLLLLCVAPPTWTNRVYVHPFYLFAADNVSCESLQTQGSGAPPTVPVVPLDAEVLAPDVRDEVGAEPQRESVTERTMALAGLVNVLGLRIYEALSRGGGANPLLSPVNTYGALVNLYLGASRRTASIFQVGRRPAAAGGGGGRGGSRSCPPQSFLGLSSESDPEDCVSLVDGHKVLRTLQSINSLVDDGPKDEITAQAWTFARPHLQLAQDFVRGTWDFSDASFTRSVDFAGAEGAELLLNGFVEKTSGGRVRSAFRNLNSSSSLLFLTSFTFQGLVFVLETPSSRRRVLTSSLRLCRQLEDGLPAPEDLHGGLPHQRDGDGGGPPHEPHGPLPLPE